MKKNSLWKNGGSIIRVLEFANAKVFVIDCIKRNMPRWIDETGMAGYVECTEQILWESTNKSIVPVESMDADTRRFVQEHFTLIAGVLPYVSDIRRRNEAIGQISRTMGMSKQSIRYYLCLYLAYQDICAMMPKSKAKDRDLTADEKNMRWGLNKFFYTKNKNSLKTAYTMLLKAKYCDESGRLLPEYPSFYQFRYFYRKHKSMQTYYISRDGLKNYQRNNRPLTGDKVQQYASQVGVGMFDATICDIFLIDDCNNLIGRPVLTACVDAYSSLCMGYSLSWEGGVYSLRGLMLNMIADKAEHCKKHGILIDKSDWNCCQLPAEFITDRGSEYISATLEQIADLGIAIVNLPSYRAELKGVIEKFFDLIQDSFKPYLKGKGVIEPNYMERGAHDYRKDACLTMAQFEKIIIRCILFYNSSRIVENYPYTEDMLQAQVKPHANDIWEWGKLQSGANLIETDAEQLILTMLPRTTGKFTRFGLKANRLRYRHDNYTEMYLVGGDVVVAYNPDDVTNVWLLENGKYVCFELIESRFKGKKLDEVEILEQSQKELIKGQIEGNLQAKIELAEHIEVISGQTNSNKNVNIKQVRKTRKKEQQKTHVDYMKAGEANE